MTVWNGVSPPRCTFPVNGNRVDRIPKLGYDDEVLDGAFDVLGRGLGVLCRHELLDALAVVARDAGDPPEAVVDARGRLAARSEEADLVASADRTDVQVDGLRGVAFEVQPELAPLAQRLVTSVEVV
jgi:hypothetical protein